jgi:hypothetical protein
MSPKSEDSSSPHPHPHPPKRSDDSENTDAGRQDVGGLIRSMIRSAIRTIGTSSLGSFPLPRPQAIAKSSSNFGDLLDIRGQFMSAVEDAGDVKGWRKVPRAVSLALPGFLKSSLCGTALFATYDTLSFGRLIVDDWWGGAAFVCGAGGGVVHGLLVSAWESVTAQVNHIRAKSRFSVLEMQHLKPYSLSGTLFSHGIAHGALFWTYEHSREVLERTLGREIEYVANELASKTSSAKSNFFGDEVTPKSARIPPSALMTPIKTLSKGTCVFIAGALAGVVSDWCSHYLEAVEKDGFRKGWKVFQSLKRPPARVLIPAIIPSSAGFLAYEFSKYEDIE